MNKSYLIFSDIDGSFMNHDDYSHKILKDYVSKIKKKCQIIFTSSKTYDEIISLNNYLEIEFPFIVENGACIFFPKNYTNISLNNNYFKYKKHIGFKIFKENLSLLEKKIKRLNERFKFRFYNEIDDKLLKKITNLNDEELKKSRSRMFSNPIFWEDSEKKIKKFEKEIKDCGFEMYLGGRFIHLSRSYDKGKAIQQFLKIITKKKNQKFVTISLGDSNNDLKMLELTDYSCVIKSSKKKLLLKKKNNHYYSKKTAPYGWKESLDYIFTKEKVYF